MTDTQPKKLVFANSQADHDEFMALVTGHVNNLTREISMAAYKRGYDAAEALYKKQIEEWEDRWRDMTEEAREERP